MEATKKLTYEEYMKPIFDMNLDGFMYEDDTYYTIISGYKVSILFDLDDMSYNVITEKLQKDDDPEIITWDWNPDVKWVYRALLMHIKNVYTNLAK